MTDIPLVLKFEDWPHDDRTFWAGLFEGLCREVGGNLKVA
ncbi:hypothetical protein RA2_04517 [Roseovarius sp. A-2]|nr:hypothetical protein RA2_04517 [Roseovarius sp. A-2]